MVAVCLIDRCSIIFKKKKMNAQECRTLTATWCMHIAADHCVYYSACVNVSNKKETISENQQLSLKDHFSISNLHTFYKLLWVYYYLNIHLHASTNCCEYIYLYQSSYYHKHREYIAWYQGLIDMLSPPLGSISPWWYITMFEATYYKLLRCECTCSRPV